MHELAEKAVIAVFGFAFRNLPEWTIEGRITMIWLNLGCFRPGEVCHWRY